ncbi:MAG: transporter [Syntrophus sp. (in: bacteria)]|nr:transporter [Syntrophus sp. (in: bacteria)]
MKKVSLLFPKISFQFKKNVGPIVFLMLSLYMKCAILVILSATVVVMLTPTMSLAESDSVGAAEQTIMEEMKAQEDPTILKRRVWSDTEWNKYNDGRHDIEETLGALWAWRVSDSQDWGVRLKVPYKFHIAGDAAGDSNEQGLGDIKLAMGTAFRFNKSWRTAVGVEMRFPSADDDLGSNAWRPQLFGTVAWDVTQRLTLSPSFEYNKSVAEVHGAAPQNFLEMYFPATYVLPRYWAVTARYEAKVDFENDDYWTHSAKLSIAKQFKRQPLGFSISMKRSFDGGDKEFQINFVTTYYFR